MSSNSLMNFSDSLSADVSLTLLNIYCLAISLYVLTFSSTSLFLFSPLIIFSLCNALNTLPPSLLDALSSLDLSLRVGLNSRSCYLSPTLDSRDLWSLKMASPFYAGEWLSWAESSVRYDWLCLALCSWKCCAAFSLALRITISFWPWIVW